MKGLRTMLGSGKRVFAGKPRLHSEPFCPFMTDDTGYQELRRTHPAPHNPGALGNTGSFTPIADYNQKRPPHRQRFW